MACQHEQKETSQENVVPSEPRADNDRQIVDIIQSGLPQRQQTVHGNVTKATGDMYNATNMTVIQPKDEPDNSNYVTDLEQQLKTHYSNKLCKKQRFPWETEQFVDLEDIYVQLTLDMEIPKRSKTIKTRLEGYHLIFEDNEEHRRFILEGRPGLGKSTLCAKIAYDWSYGHQLKHIKLLIILELGKVDYKSNIEEVIIRQLLSESHDPQLLRKTMEKCGKSVVIILDGLDESDPALLRHEEVGSIVRILRFEELPSCRVLVTSRPWRIKEMMKFKYRRLELQPFSKETILEYVKQYFGVDDTQSLILGNGLIKLIKANELVLDASIPLISLLICSYWQITNGKPIPRRRVEVYDAIITNMYQSCGQKRLGYDLKALTQGLGKVAVKGLEPAKTPKLVFKKNEVVKSCSKELVEEACAIGLVSEKGDQATCLTFFHKSGQEHLAGKYLADHSEELCSYLEAIRTVDDAMAVAFVLISTAAASVEAAVEVMAALMNLFEKEIDDDDKQTMRSFYEGKLAVEETRRIQQFIELCLECNYEASAGRKFNERLQPLFLDGKVYCFGIQAYPAVALGYYMEQCDFWIRSLTLQPVAHPSDPQIFYGPCSELHQKTLKELKSVPHEEVRRMCNDYKKKHPEMNKDLHDLPPTELVAYRYSIQQCEGLPSTSDTNLVPIIKSFQHITLEKLSIDNFKLGKKFDVFIDSINKGYMRSLKALWAQSVTTSAEQTTQLANVIDKMPALEDLAIQRNMIEPRKMLPVLAAKLVKCKSLQELSISDYDAPAEDMEAISTKLPRFSSQLQVFIAVNNHMNDDVAALLSKNLPETLTYLGISVWDLSHQKHRELLESLQRLRQLEKLRLFDSHYPSDIVECIGTGITSWGQLQEVTLRCQHKHDKNGGKTAAVQADAWKKMETSLKTASHLKGIRLFQIRLADDNFRELIEICDKKEGFRYLWYSRSCLSRTNEDLCDDSEFVTLD